MEFATVFCWGAGAKTRNSFSACFMWHCHFVWCFQKPSRKRAWFSVASMSPVKSLNAFPVHPHPSASLKYFFISALSIPNSSLNFPVALYVLVVYFVHIFSGALDASINVLSGDGSGSKLRSAPKKNVLNSNCPIKK